MKIHWISLMSLLLLALSSCGSAPVPGQSPLESTEDGQPPGGQAPASFEPTPEPLGTQPTAHEQTPRGQLPALPAQTPAPVATQPPAAVEKFINLAKRDLADHLKIDVEHITVLKAEQITWPDAALGCPSPGKVYARGRIAGYRIALGAQSNQHVYHTDQVGTILLCAEPNLDASDPALPAAPGPTQLPQIGVPIK